MAFLLVATVTVPLKGTPLSSGASAAHTTKLPKPAITTHQPRRVCDLESVLTASDAVSLDGRGFAGTELPDKFFMVMLLYVVYGGPGLALSFARFQTLLGTNHGSRRGQVG